jgi:transcription elongation GreA/GreB family factor
MWEQLDKTELIQSLLQTMEDECTTLTAAQRASQAGATDGENRAEGDKDMRATEASYLARGQALRVEALKADLIKLKRLEVRSFANNDKIAASALVKLDQDGTPLVILIMPAGGGVTLHQKNTKIQVVTTVSPLGRAVLGSTKDDVVELNVAGETKEYEIIDIR